MAFTGSPTFVQVSDSIVQITGLSLGASASGTIGLHGSTATPDVILPATFQPSTYNNAAGGTVPLAASIDVAVKATTSVVGQTAFAVAKTGTTIPTFVATVTTPFATGSGPLEIYVRFHN